MGLVSAPALSILCFVLLPTEYDVGQGVGAPLSVAGRATLAAMVWMAVWWLTEAIDVAATALLPIVLFPLLGIADIRTVTASYGDQLIFLFMGGFILALSMQRWGLGRRVALFVLRYVGTNPTLMVGAFMLLTAVFSAFVSNTATVAMMLPIAVSVIELVRQGASSDSDVGGAPEHAKRYDDSFGKSLMLGIAYAASIGGLATIIGSPPNGILVSFLREQISDDYKRSISFAQWVRVGLPLATVFLPVTWILLTRVIYPSRIKRIEGGRQLIDAEYARLGRPSRGELATFIVFMITAVLWISRPVLVRLSLPGMTYLTDYGIAMLGALLLFIIPVNLKRGEFVMNWQTAKQLPWGVLILFGGGLSLAAAVKANGVAEFLGSQMASLQGVPTVVLVLAVAAGMIFLTELTSNTATTATMVPVLAGLAPGLGVHPYLLIVPATLAASCAFMLPVATPPNAIIFGSGQVSIAQMCKAGLWLNLIGVLLITLMSMLLLGSLLGVAL